MRNKTVTAIKTEEVICFQNKNNNTSSVPTHSWLYPLIGALSVIVLILVGVLIYLGPFSNYSKNWIGPESPYNRMTIAEQGDESVKGL